MAATLTTVTFASGAAFSPPPTLAARQDLRTITQTIRLPDTTFVSLVVLGGTPRVAEDNAPAAQSSSGLTGAQIAGIISGVVGFAVVVLIVWWCVHTARRRQRQAQKRYDDMVLRSYLDEEEEDAAAEQQASDHRRRQRRMQMQMQQMQMPPPPQPVYQVNRRPPWDPAYSGPKRNLPRRRERV